MLQQTDTSDQEAIKLDADEDGSQRPRDRCHMTSVLVTRGPQHLAVVQRSNKQCHWSLVSATPLNLPPPRVLFVNSQVVRSNAWSSFVLHCYTAAVGCLPRDSKQPCRCSHDAEAANRHRDSHCCWTTCTQLLQMQQCFKASGKCMHLRSTPDKTAITVLGMILGPCRCSILHYSTMAANCPR